MTITAVQTISGPILSQPLNDNFSHIAEKHNELDADVINMGLSKKPAFFDQFITGFFGRGQIATEKATENTVTETSITVPRLAGYGAVDIADTTPFKEGSILMIKYDDGTYAPHFVTAVTSSTVLSIKPPILRNTTTATKVERGWYNSAHAGKFYMRYLAQRLANATEIVDGYGENIFYANFDGTSNDDVGTLVGTAIIGYVDPINKGGAYGDILERGVGKTAYVDTATIGGGIKFPSFYAKRGERLILRILAMNRSGANNTKIAIKSDIGDVDTFTISGASSQIMKPYYLEFTAPYDADLLYIEVTNQSATLNVIFIDEIKVMRNVTVDNYILPRYGKILAFGDSGIAGDLGSTAEREPLTQHLATLLPNATILNKGVGGNTVIDLMARFDADVAANSPDVVIIHTGVNDSYNPSSVTFDPTAIDYFVGKVKELAQKCIDIGAKPVVIGVPALAEEDLTFTTFELNDRARLYNKRLYREIFPDDHGTPKVKFLSTNNLGKLENNGVYASGNNYKDVNITIASADITVRRVAIQAKAYDASTSASVSLKVYNSARDTLIASSVNTVGIEASTGIQPLEFTIPIITLSATASYVLAFEGTALWSTNAGGSGATKDYGGFNITGMNIGNTSPPATPLAGWVGTVLIPPPGTAKVSVDNLPGRYSTLPILTEIENDTAINILDDKDRVVTCFHARLGYEFEYEE